MDKEEFVAKRRAYAKKYRKANREKRRLAGLKYRATHRDKVNVAKRKYYWSRTKQQLAKRTQWLIDYKTEHGCCVCGERHPATLVFHHTLEGPKIGNIGDLRNCRWSTVMTEIEKCVVMCTNCHAKAHWKYAGQSQ